MYRCMGRNGDFPNSTVSGLVVPIVGSSWLTWTIHQDSLEATSRSFRPVDMHVHVLHASRMRTTIEISDEHRAKLLEAAARRGKKGFSSIVQEALTQYFKTDKQRREAVRKALRVIGSLPAEEADSLDRDLRVLRQSWR